MVATTTTKEIGGLSTVGVGILWKPITFKVLYKFTRPYPENDRIPAVCLIADESGLIVMKFWFKKEEDFQRIRVGHTYTILSGGARVAPINSQYRTLYHSQQNWELSVDVGKIVPEGVVFTEHRSPLHFQFSCLSKLSKGTSYVPTTNQKAALTVDHDMMRNDILVKVIRMDEEESMANGNIFKTALLTDRSLCNPEKNTFVTCRLMGEHRNSVQSQNVIAVFNAFVHSRGNDLIIYVNDKSAVFSVDTPDSEWVLKHEQLAEKKFLDDLQVEAPPLPIESNVMITNSHDYDSESSNMSKSDSEDWGPGRPMTDSFDTKYSNRPRPTICSSIAELETLLIGKRTNTLHIQLDGVKAAPGYTVRRYLGCARCSKSLRINPNNDYICNGKRCVTDPADSAAVCRNGPKDRKMYFLLKNFKIQQNENVWEQELMAYNDMLEDLFVDKCADSFETDAMAAEKFHIAIQDNLLSLTIKAVRCGPAEMKPCPSWTLTIVKIAVISQLNESDPAESSQTESMSMSQSQDWDYQLFTNEESEMKDFLAQRKTFEVEVVSTREGSLPLPHREEEYVHKRKPQGIALHICTAKNRDGSNRDTSTFGDLFQKLHYEVWTKTDLTSEELQAVIHDCRTTLTEKKYESLVVCVSGHGLTNNIQMADDKLINIWTHLIYQFDDNAFPQFRGRPKIVLINACQSFAQPDHLVPFSSPSPNTSPNHPDFLVFSATSPGYEAFRSVEIGTHFMRTLAYVLMKRAHNTEIKKLFYLIAKLLYSPDEKARQAPQLPETRDFIFSRNFYFRP